MHIPDNYLSPQTCAVLAAAAIPVIGLALKKVKYQVSEKKETVPMLGISASLSFLMMMFNVPIPGGTTAHAVGATLLAILIGPYAASLAVTIALIMQAFLFGDGGILALGANIFNMAIIMPFVGYGLYRLFQKAHHPKVGVVVGAYLGINAAALMAGIELGLQPLVAHNAAGQPMYAPYPLHIAIPAMLFAHLLVAGWVEAGFTLAVYQFICRVAPNELFVAPRQTVDPQTSRRLHHALYSFIGLLTILSPIGLLASGTAWGEWSASELVAQLKHDHLGHSLPSGMAHGLNFNALFSDYTVAGVPLSLGYILSAVTAVIVFYLIGKLVMNHYSTQS
ncbi:cobalt transporter CbiM [Latilactobacillus curvatus]|uniref:cobalt transporter CbiM n=1 Tax=Latilactobacillus curvatus TaxID=28038 RepID=UPI0023D9A29E|nr:cobalt transporter CbiM [Latilactobacillus curvatus]